MPGDPVTLGAVAARLGVPQPDVDVVVVDVHHDSRSVTEGSAFVAIRGERYDGHDHLEQAVARGASAVIVGHPVDVPLPALIVKDTRAALAQAAAAVHHDPSRELAVIGVTGTDGKTTVTHMAHSVLTAAGTRAGLIGTLGAVIGREAVPLERTTPEASDLQRMLRRMVDGGVEACAMEVSSHSLMLHRVDAVAFHVAAFTNLSQDHLDFHGDMESYFRAKRSLFELHRTHAAVISIDDEWGDRLRRWTQIPTTTVGRSPAADVWAEGIIPDRDGSTFTLHTHEGQVDVRLGMPGRFNVDNALVAAAVALELGVSRDDVCAGLESVRAVPGRFEVVPGPWEFQVIVDYAHTPQAIEAAVAEARSLASGRVVAVVGAGGDRDREKRPLMGRAAATADRTIITSDNPRSEDPASIAAEVANGVPGTAVVEIDRAAAIRTAMADAAPGDTILVLGKGHETGQEFAEGRIEPFDDREAVRRAWETLARSRS